MSRRRDSRARRPVPAAARGVRAARSLRRAASCWSAAPEAAEYLQGQLTNDVEALTPGEGCYAALLDRKGHMQADMRVLRLGDGGDLARHRAGGARGRPRATSRCTRSAARSRSSDVDRGAGDPLADRPAQRRARRHRRRCPEHACEAAAVGGVECLAVGTARGIDLIAAGRRRRAPARGAARRRRRRGRRRGRRDPPHRGRHARASAPRWAPRRCPPRPASSSAPSASPRAATSARRPVARLHYKGKPEPPPARPAAERPGRARRRRCGWARRRSARLGSACVSPALGPIALAIVRREAEPGAELAVGEDGVTARVVDLPFG